MLHAKDLNTFAVALSLLTRFGSPKIIDDILLAKARMWFAPIGALLGFAYCIIIFIAQTLALNSSWLLAWLYIVLDLWVTRGLHYDGLADVSDAIGSQAQGSSFWKVMHDSRIGVFGAIALFMCISVQLIGIESIIRNHQWYALFIIPIFGRVLCVLFSHMVLPFNPTSLGGKICKPLNSYTYTCYIILSFAILLPLGLKFAILTYIITATLFFALKNIAQKHGGSNGDFLGTIIITGQCVLVLLT